MADSNKKNKFHHKKNLNHKQSICNEHFLPIDILWNHTIYDKQGNIVGVVSSIDDKLQFVISHH